MNRNFEDTAVCSSLNIVISELKRFIEEEQTFSKHDIDQMESKVDLAKKLLSMLDIEEDDEEPDDIAATDAALGSQYFSIGL